MKKNILDILVGFANVLMVSSLFMAGCGILVLLYEVGFWLYEGYWKGLTLFIIIYSSFKEEALTNSWLYNPDSFFGLNKILKWLIEKPPLWVDLLIYGLIFLYIFTNISERLKEKYEQEELRRNDKRVKK